MHVITSSTGSFLGVRTPLTHALRVRCLTCVESILLSVVTVTATVIDLDAFQNFQNICVVALTLRTFGSGHLHLFHQLMRHNVRWCLLSWTPWSWSTMTRLVARRPHQNLFAPKTHTTPRSTVSTSFFWNALWMPERRCLLLVSSTAWSWNLRRVHCRSWRGPTWPRLYRKSLVCRRSRSPLERPRGSGGRLGHPVFLALPMPCVRCLHRVFVVLLSSVEAHQCKEGSGSGRGGCQAHKGGCPQKRREEGGGDGESEDGTWDACAVGCSNGTARDASSERTASKGAHWFSAS